MVLHSARNMESPSIPEHLREFQPETAKFQRGYPSPVSPPLWLRLKWHSKLPCGIEAENYRVLNKLCAQLLSADAPRVRYECPAGLIFSPGPGKKTTAKNTNCIFEPEFRQIPRNYFSSSCLLYSKRAAHRLLYEIIRSLGTTPISGKKHSRVKSHSRSSGKVPGYSWSSSRSSENNSRNEKSHSRNPLSRLERCENHSSPSNSRSDSWN